MEANVTKTFLFLGLTLYLWLLPADPSYAITALISSVAGWLGLGALGTAILGIVVYGALYYFANKQMQKNQRSQQQAIMTNKNSNNDNIPVVYGRRRIGGTRAYIESSNGSGDVNGTQYFNMVLILAEGEMGNIRRVWFNDTLAFDITAEIGRAHV